jgi:hypothetical protein
MLNIRAQFLLNHVRKAVIVAVVTGATTTWAGGPRFVSGSTGFTKAGVVMTWYTGQPLYFTDPGDLSATVTHAQADAMVAAAANVWNVPIANLTLAQGGSLAEHVNSGNAYFNGTDVVFPADVTASNYLNIQIPVIYDTDGSVTDLLLGAGASDPSGCLQNGVLESVDQFGKTAVIQHAVIVLNGRCVGSDPQQLTQMQYQLTRVFGRVLGLAWSQLNDSIFTGTATATKAEEAWWPLMHPIDVRCGTYTYQCMQNAFTLRPDDLSALAQLYPVSTTNGSKTQSGYQAIGVSGPLNFPTGQGMELVNVTVRRNVANQDNNKFEAYPIVSSTTGYSFEQVVATPVTGAQDASAVGGSSQNAAEGVWSLTRIPAGPRSAGLMIQTEAINPLYYGEYAVGPYQRPVIAMSGAGLTAYKYSVGAGLTFNLTLTEEDAASICAVGSDGTAAKPAAADASGWWGGLLCATGHTSWWVQTVKANRSWTIETTAVNETGAATPLKAQLVVGVWNASDPTNVLPTVAAQAVAMNSMSLGMTQVPVAATTADATLRIAIADQYGDGRPDFAYRARILYADSISPATVGDGGGQITITGVGFQQGNQVTVNGVAVAVVSWTATQIVATTPRKGVVRAKDLAVDVAVIDPSTGGTTVMQGALLYSGNAADTIVLVSAPTALETGLAAATPFAARVYEADGTTPVAGATVSFAATGSGSAAVGTCAVGTNCVGTTDATGLVSMQVTGAVAGSVTLSATETSGGATVQVTMVDSDPMRSVMINATPQYLAAGAAGSWSVSLVATQDGAAAVGAGVKWSTTAAGFTLTPSGQTTNVNGTTTASVQATAIKGGTTNVVNGCVWTTVCATFTVFGIAPAQWKVAVASGDAQSVATGTVLAPVTLLVTDGAGHALPGAMVNVYQTSYAWEGACMALGPCAAAPVLATTQSSAMSDANGLVQVSPEQVAGVAQVVKIAASTGTQGFATAGLTVTP